MKKLTRLKLINWHRFSDVIIEFGDSTLISGENGAGKSTLLDAIQFVVTCSANHFNKAAHENGKRKLTGYIRCKTGRENQPYERTGEISAHIALEFYEESKKNYFVIGAVIDSATEGQETVVRYLLDQTVLEEEMFKNGKRPRTIAEFRAYNNGRIKNWAKTQIEAKRMIKQRFGRIEDKFFQLIPKALAFKPIDDIKDFVYSYVLDEKEVNIDALRENVRSYQELEQTLEGVKKRIEKLQEIEKHYNAVTDCIRSDRMYEYYLAQSELDIVEERMQELSRKIKYERNHLENLEKEQSRLQNEYENKNALCNNLEIELLQNEQYQALEKQKEHLAMLEEKFRDCEREKKRLLESAKQAQRQIKTLEQTVDGEDVIAGYDAMLQNLEKTEDIADAIEKVEAVIQYKKDTLFEWQKELTDIQRLRSEFMLKRKQLQQKVNELKRQRFSYPPAVELLRQKIQQEFLRIGRTAEPKVLCELLEIANEKWRDAVEGYLNTQRFYILVEPEHFDIALGIYEKLRKEKKAYGVGLINTGQLEAYDTTVEGMLSTVIESRNPYAKRFVNMVLGRVHMCEKYEELKKYDVAITPQCMRYRNHVASAIKPEVYKVPFIGKNAVRIQLEQAQKELEETTEQLEECKKREARVAASMKYLDTDADVDVKYRLPVLFEYRRTEMAMEKQKKEIARLSQNSTFIGKQMQLQELREESKTISAEISKKDRQIGSCETVIRTAEEDLEQAKVDKAEKQGIVAEIEVKEADDIVTWKKEYVRQTSDKSYEKFLANFERRRKANLTSKEKANEKMTEAMVAYKTAFDFGAGATYEAYREYAAVQDRLVTSELLDYEDKVLKARISAEEEFREQFLSKLQENMKQAQGEFKQLNKALQGITFSNETYEFIYMPSRKYSKYYDMIMDDFNVGQGVSLFSGMFHENHKEVIDELFARLALDQDNGLKTLEEFTDYRTYMDYDIKIIHSDANYSLYSKVCEEKSGGETQTPFYVTVAASFVQLYSNNMGGESVGIVMFDEAFNNMDDERIGGVLEFFHRLPLQIVIAAPPDKIQYIGPQMQETLLVLTEEKVSFVEEYRYEGSGA